jgi:hypothetical protein
MARVRTIAVSNLADPLPEIGQALRKMFPKAGIVGVGVGRRRRERRAGRPLTDEVVVKIILRKKVRPLPAGMARLPRKLRIKGTLLGQPLVVEVRTDLEQVPRAVPTRYEIPGLPEGSLCTSGYASWEESGAPRVGVLTAGHGLWKSPNDVAPIDRVVVRCKDEDHAALVRCASHLKRDGIDVALLELEGATELPACFKSFYTGPVAVADAPTLVQRLGGADDLLDVLVSFRHYLIAPQGLESIAYYDAYRLPVAGWGQVTMRHAIESQGEPDTFVGGTSGSGIVSSESPRLALGVQALSIDPRGRSRSLATSFELGLAWIQEQTGLVVTPSWKRTAQPSTDT